METNEATIKKEIPIKNNKNTNLIIYNLYSQYNVVIVYYLYYMYNLY